ncbi:hypothetical protein [Streptomyces sp. WM6372]|uniref:hypothetical protein n=1 Tax=Streptomyces sp. WM6372 TaxID=1415555 RepID=UPI0006AFAF46|nr:hypothetical protein [Streptomyces sp. WM6372]
MAIPTGFQEPLGREGEDRRTEDPGPQTLTFLYEGEEFTVSGFEPALPELSSVTDRTGLVKAGLASLGTSLNVESWHAVARATVAPDAAAAQLRAQKGSISALIEEHVEGATLRSLHARAWLTELFPGLQPRTGQEAYPVPDPQVHGDVGEDGEPHANVVYTYRDASHLRMHLQQTITGTRRANPEPYDQSILARRITRAVIAHPCRIAFLDGSESIDVLVVRDGITRLTSAWALLTDKESPTPEDIARTATDVLMAEKPQRRGAEKPLGQRMAVGRQQALAELRAEFYKGLGGTQPADRSVRLGQTLAVPAQITVGLRRHHTAGLPADEVFDDAVRSILASVHVEFKAWETAAQNVEVGSRALRRVHLGGGSGASLLDGVVGLALGRRSYAELPLVFGDQRIPGSPLWRAVYLVHHLTRPEIFEQVKKHAKDIKGTRRMEIAGYAELLGPIIDLPWRGQKKASLVQARNAWTNGGVLTRAVMDPGWAPAPCDDFTRLVAPALAGDTDARETLAVAGGVALIADKLITRNVGSAVGRTVPWRSNVNNVVAGLTQTEDGLWILATAANSFDAARECVNSFTPQQLGGRDTSRMYTIPDIDLTRPDKRRKDRGGIADEPLTQYRLVRVSDPVRARELDERPAGGEDELPPGERLAVRRQALVHAVDTAGKRLDELVEMADAPEIAQTSLHTFGSLAEWEALDTKVRMLGNTIYQGRPPGADENEPEDDSVEDDHEETAEEWT